VPDVPRSVPLGRRARKKLATRDLLHAAALQLAIERGIDNFTIQDISDAADVAPRTFFGHFPTREAALAPDQLWTPARLGAAMAARPEGEPGIRSLRAVMLAMAVQVTGDSDTLRLWRELAHRYPHLVEQFLGSEQERVQALASAVAARDGLDPQADLYPTVAAWMAWTAGALAVHRWLVRTAQPIEPFVDEIFDLLERGLAHHLRPEMTRG
jgi:AcrR family transcriptional regulator